MRSTLPGIWVPLMDAPSVRLPYCAVCGRASPLEQHHVVWRSRGELVRDGRVVPKPTVTLCGVGNILRDADGRPYCHGMAHHGMLHFRMCAHRLQYLLCEPMRYEEALAADGWRDLYGEDR